VQKLKAGDRMGRYEAVREIAKGFPGPLWLLSFGHQGHPVLALGRVVPLEKPMTEATWATLTESAWDAMEVSHPAVLPAADVVFEPTQLLTVYDYVEGEPLSVLERLMTVQHAPLPTSIALRIGIDLLDALDAFHTAALQLGSASAYGGIVSDSLIIGTDGRTRLMDVFVAGATSEQEELRMHQDRVRYIAPEQFNGELVDSRADIYAAGCILWELLANRRMHIGAPAAVERRVKLGQLPPLRPTEPVVESVIDAVHKALKLDRRHRFESAAAMATALRASGAAIAEYPAVGEFVSRLASRQLETRRKVTEHSAIAKLRDLLESRPPARNVRRSLAPAVQVFAQPAVARDSDGPTATIPQVVLNALAPEAQQVHQAPTARVKASFQGTLMGMPAPALSATLPAEMSAPLPPPLAVVGAPPPTAAVLVPHRTVPVDLAPSAEQPSLQEARLAESHFPEPAIPADAKLPVDMAVSVSQGSSISTAATGVSLHMSRRHENLQRLTWGLVGSSATLGIVLLVMLFRQGHEDPGLASDRLASTPSAESPQAPKAAPMPNLPTAPEPVKVEPSPVPSVAPIAAPSVSVSATSVTVASARPQATASQAPPTKPGTRAPNKPSKKTFVPDEL
jgi:hypothetical protein